MILALHPLGTSSEKLHVFFQAAQLRRALRSAVSWSLSTRGLASSASDVPLTSERKPRLRRGDFGALTDADLAAFERLLEPHRVVTDPNELLGFNTDWMRSYRGQGQVVLRPKSAEEVSALLRHCKERQLAVVPQGGNTSLVGASVPVFDEVIISLSLMNKILEINPLSGAFWEE